MNDRTTEARADATGATKARAGEPRTTTAPPNSPYATSPSASPD